MEKRTYPWLTIQLIFLLLLFSYLNQLLFRYQVPAGGDAFNHNRFALEIMSGDYSDVLHYHSLWHILSIGFALTFKIPSITAMAWLAPLLLVTMGSSLYLFNRRTVGPIAGIASLVLIGFFSQQPLQTLYDGGFPNVLAAGTVLPIVFVLFQRIFTIEDKKRRAIFWFIVGFVVLAYSHHLTTLYALPVVGIAGLAQLIASAHAKHKSVGAILAALLGTIIVLLGSFYWLMHSDIQASPLSLARQFMTADTTFPFFHLKGTLDNPNAIWPLDIYPNGIGEAVVYLGMGGLLLVFYRLLTKRAGKAWLGYIMLITWTVSLFWTSRIPELGFPVRLARDLAIPLALLGGIFVDAVLTFIASRNIPRVFAYLFIITCITLGWQALEDRYVRAVNPNPLINHLAVDTQAARYITTQLPLAARIRVPQDDIYLHSFAPLHTVTYSINEQIARDILDDKLSYDELKDHDYIYIEERHDRPQSWAYNDGIIRTYMASPAVTLVATFSQPEKKVYIFQINHPKAEKLTPGASP